MNTLKDSLPTLPVTDLSHGGGVQPEAIGYDVGPLRAGADFPDSLVGDAELRDLGPTGGASVALPIIRVLLVGPRPKVPGVDATRFPAKMPRYLAETRQGTACQEKCGPVHSELPPVHSDRPVPCGSWRERVSNTLLCRGFQKKAHGVLKPAQGSSALRAPGQRVSVFPVPLVMDRTKTLGVVGPGTAGERTQSLRHGESISNGTRCCLLATLINLGVPTA